MNLFKKDPKKIFELLAAIITVIFSYYMVVYFVKTAAPSSVENKPVIPPSVAQKEIPQVNYEVFGPIYIEVNSPSYAKSNFDVNPLTPITVYFNEKVDQNDLESQFKLTDKETGELVPVNVSGRMRSPVDDQEKYTRRWQQYWQEKVIFTPKFELKPLTMYQVEIMPGFSNLDQTEKAAQGMNFEFLTAGMPGVLSTNIKPESNFSSSDLIKIIFKSPMNLEELRKEVLLQPESQTEIKVNDKIMTISLGNLTPGDYQLTIPAGTKDIYGRTLDQDYNYSFSLN